jgi:hypothetical protein
MGKQRKRVFRHCDLGRAESSLTRGSGRTSQRGWMSATATSVILAQIDRQISWSTVYISSFFPGFHSEITRIWAETILESSGRETLGRRCINHLMLGDQIDIPWL